MSFGENLRWLLAHRHSTPKELADVCEVKQNTISNYANGVSTPNYEILNKIIKFLDISADEILYADLPTNGLSKDLSETAPIVAPIIAPKAKNQGLQLSGNMPKVITLDTSDKELVTLVPLKAAAGYLNGYGDPEFIEKLPTIDIPGVSGATHRAFEVRGTSMPTQHPGSIAIGRWVEDIRDIRDRRVYILLTKFDGIVLKRVLNRLDIDGKLILMSDNDNKREFPNYPIDPEEILEVWYWRGGVIREFPEPGNTHSRINDLEGRLTLLEQRLNSK